MLSLVFSAVKGFLVLVKFLFAVSQLCIYRALEQHDWTKQIRVRMPNAKFNQISAGLRSDFRLLLLSRIVRLSMLC